MTKSPLSNIPYDYVTGFVSLNFWISYFSSLDPFDDAFSNPPISKFVLTILL